MVDIVSDNGTFSDMDVTCVSLPKSCDEEADSLDSVDDVAVTDSCVRGATSPLLVIDNEINVSRDVSCAGADVALILDVYATDEFNDVVREGVFKEGVVVTGDFEEVVEISLLVSSTAMFGATEAVVRCVDVGVVSRDEKTAGTNGSTDVPGVCVVTCPTLSDGGSSVWATEILGCDVVD